MQQESLRLICLAKRGGSTGSATKGESGKETGEGGGSNQVASESLGTHTKQNATLYFATATMRLPQGRRQKGARSLCARGGYQGGRGVRAYSNDNTGSGNGEKWRCKKNAGSTYGARRRRRVEGGVGGA